MGEAHVVPLSRQAVAILKELKPLTGHGRFTFPAIGGGGRPMSEVARTFHTSWQKVFYSVD